MSDYLTKNERRSYRVMQGIIMTVGVYAAFNIATAKAETLTIRVQPPTIVGVNKAPVADYRIPPRMNYRDGGAVVINLYEEAPDNGCNGLFLDVNKGRCFGRTVMR